MPSDIMLIQFRVANHRSLLEEQTLSLVEEVRYDGAYTFAYSPRPGTAAFSQIDDDSRSEKAARLKELVRSVQED